MDRQTESQTIQLYQFHDAVLFSITAQLLINPDNIIVHYSLFTGHKSAWTAGNDLLKNGEYNWAPSYELFGEYTNFRGGAAPLIPDCACIGINARKEDDCGECIGQYKWDEEVCATLKRAVCELTVYK